MRLFSSEHQDITDLLEKYGLSQKVLLVKKKGWIYLQVRGKGIAYHRKKVTRIENGCFVDSFRYFIRQDQKEMELPDWKSIREKLDGWLSNCM